MEKNCTTCAHADDTIEIGYYFRCDVDGELRWKDERCERYERRTGFLAAYDEIMQKEDLVE